MVYNEIEKVKVQWPSKKININLFKLHVSK